MKNQILLESEPFYITERLKEIDEGYFVVFNLSKNAFEVHNSAQKGPSYAFTVPFDVLDERTITLARKTKSQNAAKLIEEIDKENENKKRHLLSQAIEQIKEVK